MIVRYRWCVRFSYLRQPFNRLPYSRWIANATPALTGTKIAYLKAHHRVLYYNLLTAGTLGGHLADIEEQAQEIVYG